MTNTLTARAHDAPSDIDEIFEGLRELMATIERKGGKHDSATILIAAAIDAGFNTGRRIIGTLTHLGFDRAHVGIILKKGLGSDAAKHNWRRDVDGTYHNLPGALTISAAHLDVSHLLKGETAAS